MKKLLPLFSCLLALCLMTIGLSACGSAKDEEDWDGEMPAGIDFVGTWHIESRWTDGHELSGDNLQIVRDYGYDSFLVLNVDATAELNLYGHVFSGTWLVVNETQATLSTDEVNETLRLDGDKLVFGDDDDFIIFARSTEEEYEAFLKDADASEDEDGSTIHLAELLELDDEAEVLDEGEVETASGEPSFPLAVSDDALVTIVVTGQGTDALGCSGYYLSIKNNSDHDVTVTRAIDSFTVAGRAATPILNANLASQESTDTFMWWDASEVSGLDSLRDVEGIIEIDEVGGFEAYGSYAFRVS